MTLRYLEMIQAIVTRMATNSFLVKGWTVTLTGAIMAFSASVNSGWSMLTALFTSAGFWWIDAYYLRQERLYRALFDQVRERWRSEECQVGDMDLSTKSIKGHVQSGISSPSVVWFHLPIVFSVLVVALVLFN